MKRLNTHISKEKKRKRNQLILGFILVFVMMLSVFGIVANSFGENNSRESQVTYNGLTFSSQGNYWYTSVGDFQFIFSNNPQTLNENYLQENSSLKLLTSYKNKPLYLYSEDPVLNSLINQNIGPFVERMQFACYQEEGCSGDYPIKNCSENFILIINDNNSSIAQNESCVYIKGSYDELPRVLDDFMLRVLGIKNNL